MRRINPGYVFQIGFTMKIHRLDNFKIFFFYSYEVVNICIFFSLNKKNTAGQNLIPTLFLMIYFL